jgi:hypothetical protein
VRRGAAFCVLLTHPPRARSLCDVCHTVARVSCFQDSGASGRRVGERLATGRGRRVDESRARGDPGGYVPRARDRVWYHPHSRWWRLVQVSVIFRAGLDRRRYGAREGRNVAG